MNPQHRITLFVEGMSCSSCIRHVDQALRAVDGVEAVEVKLREGRVLVDHGETTPEIGALVTALADAGYVARAA